MPSWVFFCLLICLPGWLDHCEERELFLYVSHIFKTRLLTIFLFFHIHVANRVYWILYDTFSSMCSPTKHNSPTTWEIVTSTQRRNVLLMTGVPQQCLHHRLKVLPTQAVTCLILFFTKRAHSTCDLPVLLPLPCINSRHCAYNKKKLPFL